MATGLGVTFQTSFLNTIIGSTRYLAIFSVAPTNGAGGTEITGTGYARIPIAPAGWAALTGTSPVQTSNLNLIDFGTSGSAWGTANALVLMDALTSGNIVMSVAIPATVINSGVDVQWTIASIVLQMGV